jgi:dienelactone hydrolase
MRFPLTRGGGRADHGGLGTSFLEMPMTRRSVRAAAALLLALGGAGAAWAQEAPTVFITRVGSDTVAVERFTRGAELLEGTLSVRQGPQVAYRMELAPDASVSRAEMAARAPGGAPPRRSVVLLRGDTALVEVPGVEGEAQTLRLPTQRGALPYLNLSVAVLEQVVLRARALGGDTVTIPLFSPAGGATLPARVAGARTARATIDLSGVEVRLELDGAGRVRGGKVPAQNVHFERVGPATARLSGPDYSAPTGAPYTAEEVTLRTPGGITLAGTLTLPQGAMGRVPAVLLLSGSGPQDRDESIPGVQGYRPFRQVADALSRRGVAVLRLDDRGVGGSGGNASATTLEEFAEDARAALVWLRAHPEVDPRRTALLGHSEGAMVGGLVAAGDTALRALVLLAAPARTGREILAHQQRYMVERSDTTLSAAEREMLLARMARAADSLAVSSRWFGSLMAFDPAAVARGVRTPVLILQGATDRQIPAEDAERLAAAFRAGGNRIVEVRVFPEVNHLFLRDPSGDPAGYAALPSTEIPDGVLEVLTGWLVERLR